MNPQHDTNVYPLNLMPGWFLASCLIKNLETEGSLVVSGQEDAVSDIRANNPEFIIGTNDDVEERFMDAMRVLVGQMDEGRLVISLSENREEPAELFQFLPPPENATVAIARVCAAFGRQLLRWCGKDHWEVA